MQAWIAFHIKHQTSTDLLAVSLKDLQKLFIQEFTKVDKSSNPPQLKEEHCSRTQIDVICDNFFGETASGSRQGRESELKECNETFQENFEELSQISDFFVTTKQTKFQNSLSRLLQLFGCLSTFPCERVHFEVL
jgi:hypothetical protein